MKIFDGGLFPRRVAKRYLARLNAMLASGSSTNPSAQVRHFGLFGFHCYFEDDVLPLPPSEGPTLHGLPSFKKG